MPQPTFPYTPARGRLKGQTFETRSEYEAALSSLGDGALDSPDSPPGGPTAPATRAKRTGKVDKAMVYAVLFPLNVGLYMVPYTRADALTDEEMDRLCEAIVKVAAVNRHVERAIVSGAGSSAYVELAMVAGAIAVKRAANHGLVPRAFGENLDGMMGLGGMPEPPPAAPNGAENGHQGPGGFVDAFSAGGVP